jgi:hypothetical protein
MTTVSAEMNTIEMNITEMNITETVLENSVADLAIEIDSQSDYTSLPEPTIPMPPMPPSIEEEASFVPGEFKYIKDRHTRVMLQNAYQAISQTETWNFVKRPIESFSFSSAPEIGRISDKMTELGYYGHSGFSFGWTMREMQAIAREGEKKYKLIAEQL